MTTSGTRTRLIFGCGYLGRRVARRWREQGDTVYVVTRNTARAEEFASAGYQPVVADVIEPESLANLPAADTVLFAVGYDRSAGYTIAEVYAGGVAAVIAALPGSVERFLYISSVGVYGHSDGSFVDEQTACAPVTDGGRASLAAEEIVRSSRLSDRAVILRLAGIYGPGRIASLARIRSGEPVAAVPDAYLNLIHVDDAAGIAVRAAEVAPLPRTYCVSDGRPVPRRDFYTHLAALLGTDPPEFTPPAPGRRGSGNKRIGNDLLQEELNWQFAFPDYRAGLAAALR